MKIKIIELLNRIANGEEMPKKINYKGNILKYDIEVQDYMGIKETGSGSFFNYLFVNKATENFINDKVEIIEEDKLIEELKTEYKENERYIYGISGNRYSMRVIDCIFSRKINELVKEINKLKENK